MHFDVFFEVIAPISINRNKVVTSSELTKVCTDDACQMRIEKLILQPWPLVYILRKNCRRQPQSTHHSF